MAQQSTMVRLRRAEARGATRVCAECGETFEPTRADAKFCSGGCKQKAYRKRVTLTECCAGLTLESRNGESVTANECRSGKILESRNGNGVSLTGCPATGTLEAVTAQRASRLALARSRPPHDRVDDFGARAARGSPMARYR
jgi:hypothetical protein